MTDQNQQFFGLDDQSFGGNKTPFHKIKTGQEKFRVLPPYAPSKLFHTINLHWGFSKADGTKQALVCTKWTHKACPICDQVDRLKTQKVAYEQLNSAAGKQQAKAIDEVVGNIRSKQTFLWNILTEAGVHKVLQLSWNGHDSLLKKVQFWWNEKRVNLTDPSKSYLIFVERSGEAAKTRYAYEVLENAVSPQAITLPKLIDLSLIYEVRTPEELAVIVNAGEDLSKRVANVASAGIPPQPEEGSPFQPAAQQQAPVTQVPTAPAAPAIQVAPPVAAAKAQAPVAPTVKLDAAQEADIDAMMAMLGNA